MKTSIFDMNFTLPPVAVMTEVMKDMPMNTNLLGCTLLVGFDCQETDMKTSIFDMTFVLPPLVEMHEVEKDLPSFRPTDMGLPNCALLGIVIRKLGKNPSLT